MKSIDNRTLGVVFLVIALLLPLLAARAIPMTRSATGATPADLENMVAVFKADLGSVDHGEDTGLFTSGYRAIDWEGLPDEEVVPNGLTPDYFNSISPRGARFSTPGTDLLVSAAVASGMPLYFGNIDSSYSVTFRAFSGDQLFSPYGSTIIDLTFFVPGNPVVPAYVTGFGAVFADVDLLTDTAIEFFDVAGIDVSSGAEPIFTLYPLVSPDGGLSFAGASFPEGEQIGRVRITVGNTPLSAGTRDGGGVDLVVMDDVIYAEPQAVPEPGIAALLAASLLSWVALGFRRRRA